MIGIVKCTQGTYRRTHGRDRDGVQGVRVASLPSKVMLMMLAHSNGAWLYACTGVGTEPGGCCCAQGHEQVGN
jgi:hypothetical protein